MIPVNELTDLDYEILEKLALAPMTETALTDSFPKQSAVKHRIALLMDYEYDDSMIPFGGTLFPKSDSYYIQTSSSNSDMLELSPHGIKVMEDWSRKKKKEHRKLVEWRITKYAPIIISIIALIVAIISLLQSLHWIHLEQSEILPTPPSQVDVSNSTNSRPSIPSSQSP